MSQHTRIIEAQHLPRNLHDILICFLMHGSVHRFSEAIECAFLILKSDELLAFNKAFPKFPIIDIRIARLQFFNHFAIMVVERRRNDFRLLRERHTAGREQDHND